MIEASTFALPGPLSLDGLSAAENRAFQAAYVTATMIGPLTEDGFKRYQEMIEIDDLGFGFTDKEKFEFMVLNHQFEMLSIT